jgi:4-amino-4-deoxy-L-arabinose transferase-like glycosyltransferase
LSLSDNVWGGDPDERIRLTARWLGLGISRPLYPSGLWLPLHFYLISIAIKIFPNIPLNVRIMHVIFGVLTIIPFYELVHLVFDKKTALISSLLFAFYPLHIVCSVTTLTEGPFLFFLVSVVYCFFAYLKSENIKAFFFCAVFLFLATLIRYEAWLFVFLLPFVLFLKKKFLAGQFLLLITVIFPVWWFMCPRSATAHYIAENTAIYLNNINPHKISEALIWWLKEPSRYNFSLFTAFFLLLGLLKFFLTGKKDSDKLYLLLFSLILFIFSVFMVLFGMSAKNKEISVLFSTFLIPFIASGFSGFIKKRSFISICVLVILVVMVVQMVNKTIFLATKICRYKEYVREVGDFLKHNGSKEADILLNNFEYTANNIPVYVGTGIGRFTICGNGADQGMSEENNMKNFILDKKPEYIAYTEEGIFKNIFSEDFLFDKKIISSLDLVLESGPYKIYRVKYLNI